MPELPEVEVLVRHLHPLLRHQTILSVSVHRAKMVKPHTPADFARRLSGSQFLAVIRRGKYLVFTLKKGISPPFRLVGHLGMTGRMYLLPARKPLPKHPAVTMRLRQGQQFVFEDTRFFGRLTLDPGVLDRLGPEPLAAEFDAARIKPALAGSHQSIKVKLLDQSVVAGIGNIYASEALHHARLSPRLAAGRLTQAQLERLCRSLRQVLAKAIAWGSTVPLSWDGEGKRHRLFYYGQSPTSNPYYEEKLRVYDRADQPCFTCKTRIRRIVQAGRSTYYCPTCQQK